MNIQPEFSVKHKSMAQIWHNQDLNSAKTTNTPL